MKRSTFTRTALAAGIAVGGFAVGTPAARADLDLVRPGNQLVECSGASSIATVNPTIKDGPNALYMKASAKRSDGTKTFLTAPIPADATTCTVDAGIRTNQAGQDVKYTLDDQSGGHATLTLTKLSASLLGSTQCNGNETGADVEYPNAYPLQGKLSMTFAELTPAAKAVKIDTYVRSYTDDDDPNASNFYLTGIVTKGPGLGGLVTNTLTFLPTDSTKNINLVEGCTDAEGQTGDAIGAELWIVESDGVDADAIEDGLAVTIGNDDANVMP
jgi:hypothetical protein